MIYLSDLLIESIMSMKK